MLYRHRYITDASLFTAHTRERKGNDQDEDENENEEEEEEDGEYE